MEPSSRSSSSSNSETASPYYAIVQGFTRNNPSDAVRFVQNYIQNNYMIQITVHVDNISDSSCCKADRCPITTKHLYDTDFYDNQEIWKKETCINVLWVLRTFDIFVHFNASLNFLLPQMNYYSFKGKYHAISTMNKLLKC